MGDDISGGGIMPIAFYAGAYIVLSVVDYFVTGSFL